MTTDLAYLIKFDNGRYYARYQWPNGKWTHKSLGADKAAVAKVRLEEFKRNLLRQKQLELDEIRPVTVSELHELHLADVKNNQARSWWEQNQYLNDFAELLPTATLSTGVNWRIIQEFRDSLRKNGLKATTCNKYLSSVKAMFRFA